MIEIIYFDGEVKRGKVQDLEKLRHHPLWIDITGITKREAEVMRAMFDLHPLTAEDLLNINTRIKVEEFQSYMFCAFYGVRKRKKLELFEMDFVLGEKLLISSHIEDIPSFADLKKNNEMLELLFHRGVDFIMHRLLDHEIDSYFPLLETIDDEIEDVEEQVTTKVRPEMLAHILSIKQDIVMIKKTAQPQREKLSSLAKIESHFISKKAMPYFRDIHDHAVRIAEAIDNYRENIANTLEVYMYSISNTTNDVMKVLSIIATITLPITAIASIYGMNFHRIPAADAPYGFLVVTVLMLIVAIGMLLFFWNRGWFGNR